MLWLELTSFHVYLSLQRRSVSYRIQYCILKKHLPITPKLWTASKKLVSLSRHQFKNKPGPLRFRLDNFQINVEKNYDFKDCILILGIRLDWRCANRNRKDTCVPSSSIYSHRQSTNTERGAQRSDRSRIIANSRACAANRTRNEEIQL